MKTIFLSVIMMLCINVIYADVQVVEVKGDITSNTTWTADKFYLLKSYVYVTNGATLTIEPGTIIKGDKDSKGTLIIERGAKIMAVGTKELPIVFTSNQDQGDRSYGDWGGVILCGSAPTNWTAGEATVEGGPRSKYGGTNPNDNSGELRYVRIEFGGIAFSPNNEVNGLTLCGVGDGTKIDYVQVSYSGDDAYEFFGGTVNAKHLVAVGTWDDDFDTDVKFNGKVQYGFVLRDETAADVSGSKAFESDSYLGGTVDGKANNNDATKAVWSNVTAVGPMIAPNSTQFDPQFVSAVHLRRGSSQSILNSIFIGWPCGVLIDESSASYGSTVANIISGDLQFRNNIIAGIATNSTPAAKEIVFVKDGARNTTPTTTMADSTGIWNSAVGPWTWLKASSNNNFIYAKAQDVRLQNPFNLTNPNGVPTSTSPISYNSKTLPAYMTANGADPFSNGKVYPFNPTKPINTDTSNLFASYNAPTVVPDFTNSKANDPFFDKVNYVGAFSGTQTTSDNWMQGWTNFDPNNTLYAVRLDVKSTEKNIQRVSVYPNPAVDEAFVTFGAINTADITVYLTDVTGKVVKVLNAAKAVKGGQILPVDLRDVTAGSYFITVTDGQFKSAAKITVIK